MLHLHFELELHFQVSLTVGMELFENGAESKFVAQKMDKGKDSDHLN